MKATAAIDNRCSEARYITNYHKEIQVRWRAELDELGVDLAWERCLDDTGLQRYAESMKALGGMWLKQSRSTMPSRVRWCVEMVDLFRSEEGLVKALRKVQKRDFFLAQGRKMNPIEESAASQYAFARRDQFRACQQQCIGCGGRDPRLKVLDVGSCYDPFFSYCRNDWDITALDLCPAERRVFQCDFVRLSVTPSLASGDVRSSCSACAICAAACAKSDEIVSDTTTAATESIPEISTDMIKSSMEQRSLTELHAASQHVVVFCLLLSFMPAAEHRWRCCLNAWKLLKPDGLLLIISPMSIQWKPHRDSAALKQWKESIEAIGFIRWQQTRVERNHCMAFRKTMAPAEVDIASGALHMPCDPE
jgi:hypothetical protein